jgi:hypothetical protein
VQQFTDQFRAARAASVPLIAVRTTDPASAMRAVHSSLNGDAATSPVMSWDALRGVVGFNQAGKDECARLGLKSGPMPPAQAMATAEKFSEDAVLFVLNAHKFWSDPMPLQGIWNLRDVFKANGSMLVMIAPLGVSVPAELSNDVLVIDEPLPNMEQLVEGIIRPCYEAKALPMPEGDDLKAITDALIGLSAFPAEQSLWMNFDANKRLYVSGLWARKRQAINQTHGLTVYLGGRKFDSIRAMDQLAQHLRRELRAKRKPRIVLFMDEIEKHFAGTGSETGQVITQMTGQFLTWSQSIRARGILIVGHNGTGKTAIAQAMAAEGDILCIVLDFSGMQGSLVGQSGERLSAALAVIDAVSQGEVFMIATCNKLNALPPELRRRFKRGTYFVDLPNEEGNAALWDLFRAKYSIPYDQEQPDSTDWTGAEIEACCEAADDLGISLEEASQSIVPTAKSAPEAIQALREFANNRFLSAAYPGTYRMQPEAPKPARKQRAGGMNI